MNEFDFLNEIVKKGRAASKVSYVKSMSYPENAERVKRRVAASFDDLLVNAFCVSVKKGREKEAKASETASAKSLFDEEPVCGSLCPFEDEYLHISPELNAQLKQVVEEVNELILENYRLRVELYHIRKNTMEGDK